MDISILKEKIDTLDPQIHKALKNALTNKYNNLISSNEQSQKQVDSIIKSSHIKQQNNYKLSNTLHQFCPDLPKNKKDWPYEWREAFEERAAIMEFDGGLSRGEAERQAEISIREAYKWQQIHKN